MTRLQTKNFVATIIFIGVSLVAAAFIAMLIGVRIPVLSNITEMLGFPTP